MFDILIALINSYPEQNDAGKSKNSEETPQAEKKENSTIEGDSKQKLKSEKENKAKTTGIDFNEVTKIIVSQMNRHSVKLTSQ